MGNVFDKFETWLLVKQTRHNFSWGDNTFIYNKVLLSNEIMIISLISIISIKLSITNKTIKLIITVMSPKTNKWAITNKTDISFITNKTIISIKSIIFIIFAILI